MYPGGGLFLEQVGALQLTDISFYFFSVITFLYWVIYHLRKYTEISLRVASTFVCGRNKT